MEPYPPKYNTAAYIERHLQDANERALKLKAIFGGDFYSFLYRPNLDHFIRQEILPLLAESPKQNVDFLDTDHWSAKHPFNFPGPFIQTAKYFCRHYRTSIIVDLSVFECLSYFLPFPMKKQFARPQ
jgi:hypothetical protein